MPPRSSPGFCGSKPDQQLAGASFGSHLAGSIANTDNTFVVVGSLATGNPLTVQAGSARIGGNINGRTINLTGGSVVADASLFNASMTMRIAGRFDGSGIARRK